MIKLFQNKIFKYIFKIIKIIFITFLCIYFSFVLVEKITYHHSLFGHRIYSISTNTMKKAYSLYDVVLVKDLGKKKLKVGNDIAYTGERGGLKGKVIIHRIVKIEKDEIYTKGVSANPIDPSIKRKQIIGKVQGKVFFFSELNHIVKNQYGFFFLIFCPLVILITIEVLKTATDIKIEKGRLQETDRLSLTEVIKIRNKTKGKKKLENTYHDIPLIVESLSLDEDINNKDDKKEQKKKKNKKDDEEIL